MKKTTATTMVLSMMVGAAFASPTLIAGWGNWTWQNAGMVSPATLTNGATGSATQDGQWKIAPGSASTDGTFGSLCSPAASTNNANNTDGINLDSGLNGHIDFTVTATGKTSLLAQFHFDAAARINAGIGAKNWTLEVVSGDISLGVAASGELPTYTADKLHNVDVDLTGLADHELAPGETATFRLSFSGNEPGWGRQLKLDNVGISAMQEPSTLGLIL